MEKKRECIYYRRDLKAYIESNSYSESPPNKDKILDYLNSGELYAQSSYYDPDYNQGMGTTLYTDGEWVWDDVLIKYFQRNSIKISEPFLLHMESKNWILPELDIFDPTIYE